MPPTSQTHSHASDSPWAVVTGHSGECFGAQGCGDRGGQVGTGGSFPVAGLLTMTAFPLGPLPERGRQAEGSEQEGLANRPLRVASARPWDWPAPTSSTQS